MQPLKKLCLILMGIALSLLCSSCQQQDVSVTALPAFSSPEASLASSEASASPTPEPAAPTLSPSPSPAPSPTSAPSPSPSPEPTPEPTPTPEPAIAAVTGAAAWLYSLPAAEATAENDPALDPDLIMIVSCAPEALLQLPAGTAVSVFASEDPLWYSVTLEDGTEGYLYGEELYRVKSDGNPEADALFQEYAQEAFAVLQEKFPDGSYWNHMGIELPFGEETPESVTDIPCTHSLYGEEYCNFYNGVTASVFPQTAINECLGFASYLSDCLYGLDAPIHAFRDLSLLRVGDHIRLQAYEHSMTVLKKTEDGITIGEVNRNYQDCLIEWTRTMTNDELTSLAWDITCYSRYPLCPDGSGGFTLWE